MARLSISLLGPMEFAWDGQPIGGFEYNKVRALLVYLALEADRPHTRSTLAALLWPDMPERAARQNLSQALTTLRHAVGDLAPPDTPLLLTTSDSIRLNPALAIALDVRCLLDLLDESEAHPHRSWHTCPVCAERLRRVVRLYRGDFLAQFSLPDSAPFEEWALLHREHLRQRVLSALERLAQWSEWHGRYNQAAEYTRRQIDLEPLLEPAHRELMRLFALSGQSSAALAHYDHLRRTLDQELGAEPEAETTALYQRIRSTDLRAPLGFRRFEPPPSALPMVPGPLFGRDDELAAICTRLRADSGRLLTLVGPPGVGKTRLALETARELHADFEDGAHWVELATLTDTSLVPSALAGVLGIKERAGQSLVATLTAYLRPKHILLALDNLEQILDAGRFIAELLAACPALKFLITSRAALRIRLEHQFPLAPLAVPLDDTPPDQLLQAPAVQLFLDRARAVQPGFSLHTDNAAAVAAICARVDGLPLALELTAARVDALSPADILLHLDRRLSALDDGPRDLPLRQQTLRRAIQWSYDLLDTVAQRVFAHLGVFVGGFTLDAARAIVGDDVDLPPILAALQRHSLLQPHPITGETRYTMLETIREFALEALAAFGAADSARRRHCRYFLALAENAQAHQDGILLSVWHDRLERDHDNLRAALAAGLDSDDDSGLRLAAALATFWEVRGYLGEGRRWLSAALAAHPDAPLPLRAEASDRAGALAYRQGDYPGAQALHLQSLAIWQSLEQPRGIVRTLRRLGTIAWEQGDTTAAQTYLTKSLALARATGDTEGIAGALNNLGLEATGRGDFAAAHAAYAECLTLFQALNDQTGIGNVYNNMGLDASKQGDYAAARAHLEASLAAFRSIGHKWGVALALLNLGNVAHNQLDLPAAQSYFEQSLALYQELDDRATVSYPLFGLGGVHYRQGDYAVARALMRQSLALRHEAGEQRPIPRNLEGLAQVARAEGRPDLAARLFGAAEALREVQANEMGQDYLADYRHELAAVRAALGKAAFTRAWAEGRALTLDQAVALALETSPRVRPTPKSSS